MFQESDTLQEALRKAQRCGKCVHVNVCALYRAISPLINSFKEYQPFNPQDLAKICQEFMPTYTTKPIVRRVLSEKTDKR